MGLVHHCMRFLINIVNFIPILLIGTPSEVLPEEMENLALMDSGVFSSDVQDDNRQDEGCNSFPIS